MPELDADFEISTNNLEAEYEISEGQHFDCSFEIYAAGTTFSSITGSPYNNSALSEVLNQKADNSTVENLAETVQDNYNTLNNKIDTHITDKSNPHEVTKAQIGLGNVDNTSDLDKPISTATQTALNGKQNTISDLSTIRTNASNGQSAYNTIQTYGDIVTYDASSFATNLQGQKADTALQPNDDITKLNNNAGYITSADVPTVNNSTITFQKNNVTVGDINLNQPNNETINFSIPTTASDVNALPDTTTINDLTTSAQQNAINSGATSDNIGQIATNTSNLNSLQETVTNNYNTLDGRITSEVSTLNTAIGTETTNRQNADNNLQSQIDAIVSSSDVFDIVGTYAELEAYDISTVPVNDIIKVLVDSTHSNAATYYRCVESDGVKSWSYIGAEGAYYTKSESDSLFVEQTTTVNGKALSNNITLTASDIGALPSSTTIGNGILTIQNNGVDVDTFGANATSNKSINLVTPTKTSDLVNDSGFIDSSDLSSYATQTDLTNGLATKQDTISDLSTIRQNAQNGQSAYTTIQGFGDIVTYNASNFATSAQGSLADTALQQGDDISLLNNDAGYTSNIGTVTSVNGNQPDSSGNVTISVSGGANTDLSNLTATGEAHFQKPLVSGTNIKTINNASILGSGNIDTSEVFIAEYGVTTYQEVLDAYNLGKTIYCKLVHTGIINPGTYFLTLRFYESSNLYFSTAIADDGEYLNAILNSSGWQVDTKHAVFSTTSGAIGSSTVPIYINSSGQATSTGLSIANSRFDGQWVGKYANYTWSSKGSYTIPLSDYLPADRINYSYYIYVTVGAARASSNGTFRVGTVASPADNVDTAGNYSAGGYMNSSSSAFYSSVIIPVAAGGDLYAQLTVALSNSFCRLIGYRRIGTNS